MPTTPYGHSPYHATLEHRLPFVMGGTEQTSVDGVGVLTYQRAIDIARNTEGDLDANVADYLESAVNQIQSNLDNYPDSYVFTKDEFAVFNYFRQRFSGEAAEHAVNRYWRTTHAESSRT
ncbi:hypothetical protein B0A48_09046 [Cryoendolithus antarcticus]|uniref:Uncharacterized protein n=1 Tax=Cryoendolithus antarcticus TaxID=1507870 RepID=A0A1V8T1U0_9PEZI|nr:hypothetical protein B0A48_09046 [Cryoendolithus antarcticus]